MKKKPMNVADELRARLARRQAALNGKKVPKKKKKNLRDSGKKVQGQGRMGMAHRQSAEAKRRTKKMTANMNMSALMADSDDGGGKDSGSGESEGSWGSD